MGERVPAAKYHLTRYRGVWHIAVWQNGRRTERLTLGTADRSEAERLLASFITERTRPSEITVAYLWRAYAEDNPGKPILLRMEYSGKVILPEFGHLVPDDITIQHCRAYIDKRTELGRKRGTIWTELNHLAIVLNWGKKHRLVPNDVAIERPSKPPPRDRRLTRPEAQRLLDAAEAPHIELAISLMLGTAARITAILELTWDRVDFEGANGDGLITYAAPDEFSARRKGRATVPMTPSLRQRLLLARRAAVTDRVVEWAGRPVASIKKGFARAVRRAGLVDVSPHVLRHTAATWMAEAGVPMAEIAAVLGHRDSRTTERIYARFSPTYLRSAVAALDI